MYKKHKGFSLFTTYFSVAAAALTLLLIGCARIGSPDGGPYDETPPRILRTTPKFGSLGAKDTKVTIDFDEIIKVENAQEKVVVSPPQIEQPDIETIGKQITIRLNDSLKPNTTYTIDFADAIVDNNESNPMGDYAFTFSTGDRLDTMQVSGYVLEAGDLEPIKGMLVGLYRIGDLDEEGDTATQASVLPDSIFRTKPLERISRTDGSGHFVVKGVAPGKYRAFALNDQNQNFVYDQNSEKIAFSDRVLVTSSKLDSRNDTIWHDSIYYDSIVNVPYTHYYPDDIVLMAFTPDKQNHFLLKSERPTLEHFTIFFTSKSDTLPKITGINFDSEDAFVVDASQNNDTINYWIRDSLIFNLDTLEMQIEFLGTDSLGGLSPTVDTLRLVSKLTKEKMDKQMKTKMEEWAKEYKKKYKLEQKLKKNDDDAEAEEKETKKSKGKKKTSDDDDIEIPPLPEEFLEYKTSNVGGMAPDQNVDFIFPEPLDSVDMSKLHFSIKRDSLFVPARFIFKQVAGKEMVYRLYAEWEPDSVYQIEIDTAAFVSIYGKRNEATKRIVKMKSMDTFSTLFVVLQNADTSAIVQLIDASDKPVKSVKAKNGKADFYFMNPSVYYMRMFYDLNGNGKWDTGDYDEHLQPEPMFYYPGSLTLKALWEITQDWNPTQTDMFKQKPAKITKQKPDKQKSIKNKNAERELQKQKERGNKK